MKVLVSLVVLWMVVANSNSYYNEVNQISGRKKWFRDYDGGSTWNGVAIPSNGRSHQLWNDVSPYLRGTTATSINWKDILAPQYTICTIARYSPTSTDKTRGRIFDGSDLNWLHGFHGRQTAVAHYGGWNAIHSDDQDSTDWIIFCGQNAGDFIFRSNGKVNRSNGATNNQRPEFVGTNQGQYGNEKSDFDIMEIITWSRALTSAEINKVIDYMEAKLELESDPAPAWEQDADWLTTVDSDGSTNTLVGQSSSLCSGGVLCAKGMFDGNENTRWHCNKGGPCSFELDLGEARVLHSLYATSLEDRMATITFETKSEASEQWQAYETFTSGVDFTNDQLETMFQNTRSARYVKVLVNCVGRNPAIGELKFKFGEEACLVNYVNVLAELCYYGTSLDQGCAAGKYYYAEGCQDSACVARDSRQVFYGSQLHGTWDSVNSRMSMYIEVPYDVSINDIEWIGATATTLKYTMATAGHWTLDMSSHLCFTRYTLDVAQTAYFGTGSAFALTGSQMKTSLRVLASQEMKEAHQGNTYSYSRSISNAVPVIVNLDIERKIKATFKIKTKIPDFAFVLFKGAVDNLDVAAKTIELSIEIHSHNCVAKTLSDGTFTNGVRLKSGSNHVKDNTTPTFTWNTEETVSVHDFCVQSLTWVFVPKSENLDTSYDMTLEFVAESGTKFEAVATIEVKSGDVLGDIGFDGAILFYEEKECINEKNTFYLGDQFFAKISLTNLVLDTSSITCRTFGISQVHPGDASQIIDTDLIADEIYNFQEFNLDGSNNKNSHVCSAELQSTHFHKTSEGYTSTLITDVQIEYKSDGTTRRRKLRLQVSMNSEEKESGVGQANFDEYFENKEHKPDSTDLSAEMFIEQLNPLKAMKLTETGPVSAFYENHTKIILISCITLFGGVLLVGLINQRKNNSMEIKLLEQEDDL